MTNEVTIGLAAFCAHWFEEVGLQEDPTISKNLHDDYDRMVAWLRRFFGEVVAPGVISTEEGAAQAVARFRDERTDAVLLVHILWSEDQPLIELLRRSGGSWPILLWDYHPIGRLPSSLRVTDLFRLSGTVGMLQGSAPMQRLGVSARIVSGAPGEVELGKDLETLASALSIRKELHGTTAGRLAGRCEVMTGTHVDSARLKDHLGVTLHEFTAAQYVEFCAAVSPERTASWRGELEERYPRRGVTRENLDLACRNALAIDDLVVEHDLRLLAIQDLDPELHRLAGGRPCLCPPGCSRRGIALVAESDVNTGVGMLAAMRAAASPALYTEIFTYDPLEEILLMGHAAPHDPRIAADGELTLVPDAEYRRVDPQEGVWQEFIMREGEVTCVGLYDNGSEYVLTVFEGNSLGAPRRLEGFAHAVVRPDVPVRELLSRLVRRGTTQHFAIVPGRVASILEAWCAIEGIKYHREAHQ